MTVLVTGGMGYIGSHTCVQMIEAGMEPIIIDNLCNSKMEVLNRIEALTGKNQLSTKVIFVMNPFWTRYFPSITFKL